MFSYMIDDQIQLAIPRPQSDGPAYLRYLMQTGQRLGAFSPGLPRFKRSLTNRTHWLPSMNISGITSPSTPSFGWTTSPLG